MLYSIKTNTFINVKPIRFTSWFNDYVKCIKLWGNSRFLRNKKLTHANILCAYGIIVSYFLCNVCMYAFWPLQKCMVASSYPSNPHLLFAKNGHLPRLAFVESSLKYLLFAAFMVPVKFPLSLPIVFFQICSLKCSASSRATVSLLKNWSFYLARWKLSTESG